MRILTARNPALNHIKIGSCDRPNRIALYRVRTDAVYGRKTV